MSATSEASESQPFVAYSGPPGTRFVEIRRFESIDSTNRYLIDMAARGAPEGLVAVASFQSAGRGRLGRSWEAPPGANLLASVLFKPKLPPSELHLLSIAVALAAADACREVAGIEVQLKWPNDLYVGPRKLAGVLSESVPSQADRRAVVVGLGLNVGWPPPESDPGFDAVPRELEDKATSLVRETASSGVGGRFDLRLILELVLGSLEHRVEDLSHGDGRRRQAAEYRGRCATVGRQVSVTVSGGTIVGTAVDITNAGHLVVDAGEGFRTVSAGDVVHVD